MGENGDNQGGGGTSPGASANHYGRGICKYGDGDYSASQLGSGFGLHRGLGWRICQHKDQTWCKNKCSSTSGCKMISHSHYCCFLFKKTSCSLESRYASSYSTLTLA